MLTQIGTATIKVSKREMHSGRITPMLYGSFIELWDDHVPGMWAEMLNDRSFEGLIPRTWWCYYIGEPNVCDRDWDVNDTWSRDDANPFNGLLSARITAPGAVTQSGLSVEKGATYNFSGYFRADNPGVTGTIKIKALLPDGSWMILGSAQLPKQGTEWKKFTCDIASCGTTDRAVFEISAEGSGNLWTDKVSLMKNDNIKGWRRDVVEAIKDLKVPMIRWGGSVVDPGGYKWKNGIGPRDLRVPFPNSPWGRRDPNDVGIDEFLAFCEIVNAVPLICVSFSDGPQSAMEMVEYCNGAPDTTWGKKRAENGHPEPYNVHYWQIGNEMEGEDYAKGFVALCKAIRQADPEAIILASFPSQELVDHAGPYIDYICPHYYREDFETIQKDFRDALAMAQKAAPGREIKVGITEWNFINPWGRERARLLSLEAALRTGQWMNLLYRNSDVIEIACRSNMCNSLGDGIIQTNPSGLMKPPAYYAMKLYTELSKPVPVVVTGGDEKVDAMACRSEDAKSLSMFIVNMDWRPLEVNLDLSEYGDGFVPIQGQLVCDTQNMRQKDAQNHWTAPDRIRTVGLDVSGQNIELPPYSLAAIECKASLPAG